MASTKHSKELTKFLFVLGILTAYFAFAIYSYGIQSGIAVTALTWSFFVFCTPIADAGFLLDFPIRLATGIKMLYSEIIVWVAAFILNAALLTANPNIYQKTKLLGLFHHIITNPWPLWLIIGLSLIGTFASVIFDDSLYDAALAKRHKHHAKLKKSKLSLTLIIFGLTLVAYLLLLKTTHISIKLI